MFIVKTPAGVHILVHPITMDNCMFVPFTYGYAMTIRRSQGSTLDLVGLWFDHTYPADRGYAYVGSSRVRRAIDLYLMGKIKRTDWLPVGGDEAQEQTRRDLDSQTTCADSNANSQDENSLDESDSDIDPGASDSDEPAPVCDSSIDPGASDSASRTSSQHDNEDAGASDTDEQSMEPPCAVGPHGVGDMDGGDYDKEADIVDEAHDAEELPVEPAAKKLKLVSEDNKFSEQANRVTRAWYVRERIRGPHQQLKFCKASP